MGEIFLTSLQIYTSVLPLPYVDPAAELNCRVGVACRVLLPVILVSGFFLESDQKMALPRYLVACLHTGQLALLALLVSAGVVLQILACALYNNWWPMLTVIMYVVLPMPLVFFAGSDTSFLSCGGDGWMDFTKFLTGASVVGSIAIPAILKHAYVIGWGALAMELSSFFIFVFAIICYMRMFADDGDYYSLY